MDVRSKLQRNTENKMFTSLEAEQVQLDILGQQNKTKLEVGTIIMHVHVHVGSLHNNFSAFLACMSMSMFCQAFPVYFAILR